MKRFSSVKKNRFTAIGDPHHCTNLLGQVVDRRAISAAVRIKRKLDTYATYNVPASKTNLVKLLESVKLNDQGQYLADELGLEDFDSIESSGAKISALTNLFKSVRVVKQWRSREPGSWADDIKALSSRTVWDGGSESHTFNRLEEIALEWRAKTPVLGARVSRVLESSMIGVDYLPSRINWVVQVMQCVYMVV